MVVEHRGLPGELDEVRPSHHLTRLGVHERVVVTGGRSVDHYPPGQPQLVPGGVRHELAVVCRVRTGHALGGRVERLVAADGGVGALQRRIGHQPTRDGQQAAVLVEMRLQRRVHDRHPVHRLHELDALDSLRAVLAGHAQVPDVRGLESEDLGLVGQVVACGAGGIVARRAVQEPVELCEEAHRAARVVHGQEALATQVLLQLVAGVVHLRRHVGRASLGGLEAVVLGIRRPRGACAEAYGQHRQNRPPPQPCALTQGSAAPPRWAPGPAARGTAGRRWARRRRGCC